MDAREQRTLAAIDEANAEDPERAVVVGAEGPLQEVLGRIASDWVDRLDPLARPAQRLAARAHHLRRWEVPRHDFPEGRAGYLRWRTAAKKRHSADLALLLGDQGWDEDTVDEACRLVRKEGLGRDRAAQIHEDAVCLAFLTVQVDEAAATMGDKTVGVLRRTAAKMSPEALAHAADLPLSAGARALWATALTPEDEGP